MPFLSKCGRMMALVCNLDFLECKYTVFELDSFVVGLFFKLNKATNRYNLRSILLAVLKEGVSSMGN